MKSNEQNLVRAQESCACTWCSCMQRIPVHAQDSCACTRIMCVHKILGTKTILSIQHSVLSGGPWKHKPGQNPPDGHTFAPGIETSLEPLEHSLLGKNAICFPRMRCEDIFLIKQMIQKCLGGVWDYPWPILDHFRPISRKHHQTHIWPYHHTINTFCKKLVFSRLGSILKMGSSSDRQNSSRGDARLVYLYPFPEKLGFPARGCFHEFGRFSSETVFSPESVQKSLWGVWE